MPHLLYCEVVIDMINVGHLYGKLAVMMYNKIGVLYIEKSSFLYAGLKDL